MATAPRGFSELLGAALQAHKAINAPLDEQTEDARVSLRLS